MISSDYHEVDRNVIEILVDHGIDHEDRYGDDAADDDVGNDDDDDGDDGDDDDESLAECWNVGALVQPLRQPALKSSSVYF